MNLRRLAGSRLLAGIRFVLGGALVWAACGLVAGLLSLVGRAPLQPVEWVVTASRGFGFGWWGGLIWCTVLALGARQPTPDAGVAGLARATRWAAAAFLLVGGSLLVADQQPGIAVGAGILAATVLARVIVVRGR